MIKFKKLIDLRNITYFSLFLGISVLQASDLSLHDAAYRGDLAAVQTIIANYPDPASRATLLNARDKDNWTAFNCAIFGSGSIDIAHALINADADILNDGDCTMLHIASRLGLASLVQAILKKIKGDERYDGLIDRPQFDHYHERPLHLSLNERRIETACILIAAGADLFATNEFNETALYLAVTRGLLPVVEAIVQKAALMVPNKSYALLTATRLEKTPLEHAQKMIEAWTTYKKELHFWNVKEKMRASKAIILQTKIAAVIEKSLKATKDRLES